MTADDYVREAEAIVKSRQHGNIADSSLAVAKLAQILTTLKELPGSEAEQQHVKDLIGWVKRETLSILASEDAGTPKRTRRGRGRSPQ